MNILVVSAMFPPIQTGTSFYTFNVANTLTELGHNVTVVTVKNSNLKSAEHYQFDIHRLKAFHIQSDSYFKHLRFSSFYLSNYRNLKQICKESRSDIILLVNHYLDIAFPAIFAAKKLNLPLFVSVGTQMQSLNPVKNRILRLLDRVVCGNMIFPFCQNIISWDSEIERYISEVQSKKIAKKSVIIPFGPNGDVSKLIAHEKDYSISNTILGVGAVISQRDYLFQIRVFNELQKVLPNLKLKIIGHIYDESAVNLAKKLGLTGKVEFTGEIPHESVIDELKKADIHWMMLSGEYVGLGTATLEAMALGVPVISNVPSDLFGDALLGDMKNYIYTDGKNIPEITTKINFLLQDIELRKKIGQSGKIFIKDHLSWEKVGHQLTNLFKKSIELDQ